MRTRGLRSGSALAIAAVLTMGWAVGAFAQSASSSAGSASSAGSDGEVTFTYADVSEPSSLNPMVGYLGTDYTMWAMNYDLLINFSTTDFSPDFEHSITTSVDVSSDSMSFTYHLRPNMKWSDGQPFTADDVAWTLNYYKENNVPNYSSDLSLMDKAVATDPTTVVITSTQPTSLYSGETVFLYEYILPKHIWSKYDNDYHAAKQETNAPSVGSGPFIITKYVKNQFVELDRNPNYWGESAGLTPHVDRVVYQIFGNQDAEAAALQAGKVDFGYFTSGSILNTLKARGIQTRGATIPSFGEIGINTGSAYQTDTTGGFAPHGDGSQSLTDPIVRQAIRRAVDNEVLVDKVLLGYGAPGVSPVQPGATTGAFQPGPDDPDLSFNIQAANDMLDQAGYTMGPDGIRIDPKTKKPLEFRFFSRGSDQPSIDIVPFVSSWLKQIGIKINPETISSAKLGNVILAGDYDLFEWGWYPNPDPNYILDIFTCQQRPPDANTYRNSDSYYCNPEYDKLYTQQQSETDPAKRADIVHQMQSMLYQDQPYVVLWNDALLEGWSSKWTGFLPQPEGETGDILATYGPLSFISLRPVTGSSAGTTSGSGGIPLWVWIAILALVVIVIIGIWVSRHRQGSDENVA
ncbi:MAG: ABC transporter substrate-binding protein [Actinomycetota bacterium]